MADPLEISHLGNPVLRQVAKPIQDVHDPAIQALIDDLISTVVECKGVGIAAPQVAQSCRLLVVASHPNDRYPHAPTMEPTAMINPRLVDYSEETVKDWEGCLSIPGIRALVPRHRSVAIEYGDRHGHLQTRTLTDFVARIFQHEFDHLNGLVFLDRVERNQDIITEQEYKQRILPQG